MFPHKVTVQVHYTAIESAQMIIEQVCKEKPRIIGFSLQMGSELLLKEMMDTLSNTHFFQSQNPLIVFGNVLSTFASDVLLKQYPYAIAVIGEGEYAMQGIIEELINKNKDFSLLPNLRYNRDNNLVSTLRKAFPIEQVVSPSSDCMSDIVGKNGHVWIEASRGCNKRCLFCSRYPVRSTRWEPIPVETVMNTIKELVYSYGVRHIRFTDDDFMGVGSQEGESHALSIAHGILSIKKRITFDISTSIGSVYSRGDTQKDSTRKNTMFNHLKNAGLTQVFLGIESGSDSQLKRFAKGVTAQENYKAVKAFESLGIQVVMGYITIDYMMSLDELQENLCFLERVGAMTRNSHVFVSDVLTTLRAQMGSSYIELLAQHDCLMQRNKNMLTFDAQYQDVSISDIVDYVEEWKQETFSLVYALKNRVSQLSMQKIHSTELKLLEEHLYQFKYLDFQFLSSLCECAKTK